ncbi:tetratricopeptide repeat protein [Sphingomonas sp. URHD0057]|uniref:tetratricopeptide repeat protein n=1 Tax=Sphingomonas sp. URHD0057 TaxID=1380389 RepID=UPI0006880095|nr:tetratricopeptide repeat protein [Sphingomonas sp. URHD0057]
MLAGAAVAALALVPGTAAAKLAASGDPNRTYVEARAAAMNGDHGRSAALFAAMAETQPSDPDLAKKGLGEALGAGQIDLALRLARSIPTAKLPTDARLLLVADEVRRRRLDRALPWLSVAADNGDLSFLSPVITAWDFAERGDLTRALTTVDQIPVGSLLAPLRDEEKALILLKFRRTADAEPYARRAIGSAGSRETRLRLALADGFLAAGDRARAQIMLEGIDAGAGDARQRILGGRRSGQAIDNSAKALSEILTAFGTDLARMQRTAPPIGLVQVARYANPDNSGATILLALLLDTQGRSEEALGLLRAVPPSDAMISEARDGQARVLSEGKRFNEAYAVAAAAAAAPNATASDFSRLGDVYQAMKRYNEAANAYGRAIALGEAQGRKSDLWTMLLLQASALQEANRWPETKQALEKGLALAPDQPLLLNFLGYAKLEKGEDTDAAEAMIRKASALAPEDASIIDSLGWAQFKRGKTADAITTLQKAAEKDPDQAEIQEHLGDALYTSGRRYEARFAWSAALVTGEDEIVARVKAKLTSGLTTTNAAP